MSRKQRITNDVYAVLQGYPYFIINNEIEAGYNYYAAEIAEIAQNYQDYKYGVDFYTEGTAGSYTPSVIHFKNAKTLIEKEARFMFSQPPDIVVQSMSTDERENEQIKQFQKLVDKVLKKSSFYKGLLISAKDCFIGKRVACLVDYSKKSGIRTRFYDSLHFYYEKEAETEKLTKFICFEELNNVFGHITAGRYLVNRYEIINDAVYMSSIIYSSNGVPEETLIPETKTELKEIPAVVILNDGTLADKRGVSEIESLIEHEEGYNRLANGDIDSDRKGMNPIKYTVDMNQTTTKNLPTGPGAYWDLKTEQNQNEVHPMIGTIAPPMTHTEAVKTTLERIKTSMYNELDVPDISTGGLLSGITSFKALRALYFPLEARCNEKLMTWKPAIESIIEYIIELALLNKNDVMSMYVLTMLEKVQFEVEVVENYALLADETEEKETDLQEISHNARSRKSYMQKWRKSEFKSEDKIDQEIMQIAIENNMFDTLSMNTQVQGEIDKKINEEYIEESINSIEV